MTGNDIAFISLTGGIDTSKSDGELIYQVFGRLSEFERNIIIDRTKGGLATTRAQVIVGGAKPKLALQKHSRLKEFYDKKEMSIAELCAMFGISNPILHRCLNK